MMQSIMFSTAARGTHIHRPAQSQPASALDQLDDEGSTTTVSPLAATVGGSAAGKKRHVTGGTEIAVTTAESTQAAIVSSSLSSMDIDHDEDPVIISNDSNPTSSFGKRSYAAMTLSDDPSTPIVSERSDKKPNRGRGASRSQSRSHRNANSSLSASKREKVTSASAMVGMQAQIGRLTDVFEKSMKTGSDDGSAKRSLAIARLQEVDDGLSNSDTVKLFKLFQRDTVAAQTYLDIVRDDLRQLWLHSTLEDLMDGV